MAATEKIFLYLIDLSLFFLFAKFCSAACPSPMVKISKKTGKTMHKTTTIKITPAALSRSLCKEGGTYSLKGKLALMAIPRIAIDIAVLDLSRIIFRKFF
jgi:hypothetical protein